MIALIVAVDKQGVIGREHMIPWRLRDDLIKLKELTAGRAVILGRKTYDSMLTYYDRSGRPMPGALYIVVTRNRSYKPARDNATVAHSIEDAIEAAENFGDDIMVIGGEQIFTAMLPCAQRIYLTEVQTVAAGDAHFPVIDKKLWWEISREHHSKDVHNDHDYDFVVFERNKS
nr:Dihydrofolate reductase [uncultured bacterium]